MLLLLLLLRCAALWQGKSIAALERALSLRGPASPGAARAVDHSGMTSASTTADGGVLGRAA